MSNRVKYPPIEPPDSHYLDATMGWLMLGNPAEARAEFEELSEDCRNHPAVLGIFWRLLAAEKNWRKAAEIGAAQVAILPTDALGYINRSFALHELGQTAEALELLLPVAGHFTKEWIIPYNIACYYCRMGDLPAAREWLDRCFAIELPQEEMARRAASAQQDPDLAALREASD